MVRSGESILSGESSRWAGSPMLAGLKPSIYRAGICYHADVNRRTLLQSIPAAALLSTADLASGQASNTRVYELRVYHTYGGKLPDLLRRFREHTTKIFERHGIKNVAYWVPTDEPQKSNMLIYMLAHNSREAADANWKAFRSDPEWIAVRDASEANGKLVEKIDSTFLATTDFSPPIG
jgi:NIPSNAP protein